jgi:hypothetical protein
VEEGIFEIIKTFHCIIKNKFVILSVINSKSAALVQPDSLYWRLTSKKQTDEKDNLNP